ncbi:hypothetical protein HDU81_006033 [Chytriomyces hyalinus]|nr:hypothetical protein HDU81_006033 [Chytriomyces hyalinus]
MRGLKIPSDCQMAGSLALREPFHSIQVTKSHNSNTELIFRASEYAEGTVTCHDSKSGLDAFVIDGKLNLTLVSKESFLSFGSAPSKVTVTLPNRPIQDLQVSTTSGSVTWNGPNILGNVDISVAMGEIKINTHIDCTNLNVSANAGSISIKSITCTNTVLMQAFAGEVSATVCDYMFLKTDTKIGSANLKLSPALPLSRTVLHAGTGDVKAVMADFTGRFIARARIGDVKVSGPNDTQRENPCSGYVGSEHDVGEDVAEVTFEAAVGIGSVKVEFL